METVCIKSEIIYIAMRVNRLFVKDAIALKEFAYLEEKNESNRQQMEDSTLYLIRLCRR